MSIYARLTGDGSSSNAIELPHGYLLPIIDLHLQGLITERNVFNLCNDSLRSKRYPLLSTADKQTLRKMLRAQAAATDKALWQNRVASLTTGVHRGLVTERQWREALGV